MRIVKNRMKSLDTNLWVFGVLSILCIGALQAQCKNEIALGINGPVAVLEYDQVDYKQALDDGIGISIGYGRYLSPYWSLRTGAALQTYTGNAKLNTVAGSYTTQDSEAETFEFRYQFDDYREEQRATYIQIPILVQYEGTGQNRFFIAAGAKVGLLLNSEYKTEAANLSTAGYYEQYDALLEAPRFAGFGDFGAYTWESESLALKTNVMLSAETGLKLGITEASSFYLSVYLDYGLNNVFDATQDPRILEYNADQEVRFTGNSILSTPAGAVDAIKTVSFGFKLKYGFGF